MLRRRWLSPRRRSLAVPLDARRRRAERSLDIVHTTPNARDITCTCPGHVHRGICKHMGAILVRLDLEAEMELASAAAAEDREVA